MKKYCPDKDKKKKKESDNGPATQSNGGNMIGLRQAWEFSGALTLSIVDYVFFNFESHI